MRFEKWSALGNDYLIVEAAALPWEPSEARVRRLCDSHFGVGADGVLLLAPHEDPGYVAELRIFNPDGSEAELSGNGARQAVLYLRQAGWTDADVFTILTKGGPVTPRILSQRECTVAMGRASARSEHFPSGPPDGRAVLEAGGRSWSFQHVSIGNPQCAIELGDDELERLDLAAVGPEIEQHALFPNRTNVSFFAVVEGSEGGTRLRARIFERGVGETLSSGTGACAAAVAAYLAESSGPFTVELDGGELVVEVSDRLEVQLTGWAEPLYRGELSTELL